MSFFNVCTYMYVYTMQNYITYVCMYVRKCTSHTAIPIIIEGRETACNGCLYQFTTGKRWNIWHRHSIIMRLAVPGMCLIGSWSTFTRYIHTCNGWRRYYNTGDIDFYFYYDYYSTANLIIIDVRCELSTVFRTSLLLGNRRNHDNGRQLLWEWQ